MTKEQKQQITQLRGIGRTYVDIANTVNLPESTVKSFCWRNRLTKKGMALVDEKNLCRNCCAILIQQADAPPRKFCSDKCRFDWWRKNRKPNNSAVCACCNKEFFYYGKAARKYCGQRCCTKHRFGEDAYDQSPVTARG